MTRALADGRRVTGVDLSARQLELARANVPEATFIQADMTTLDLPPASLDAVVAVLLAHASCPQAELPDLLASIHRGFGPAVCSSATMGAQEAPDEIEADWLGVPMFFGHPGRSATGPRATRRVRDRDGGRRG